MAKLTEPTVVYYEIVRSPYFALIHTKMGVSHERYDQYRSSPAGLIEFMLAVVEHIAGGQAEALSKMCELDAQNKKVSSHRTRRYIAESDDELYAPVEYKGFGFSTNADKSQAFAVINLACKAVNVPFITVRKLAPFKHAA